MHQNSIQLIEPYIYRWKWILCSALLFLLLGYAYYRYANKSFYASATILLEDEKKASGQLSGLGELGITKGFFNSSASFVNDQTLILQSRRIMRKVLDQHDFHVLYYIEGKLKDKEIAKSEAPYTIRFLEADSNIFNIRPIEMGVQIEEGGAIILKLGKNEGKQVELNKVIASPLGRIMLLQNPNTLLEAQHLKIRYLPKEMGVDYFRSRIQISPNKDMQSFAINLSMVYPSLTKAKEILNALVETYKQDISEDKLMLANTTIDFIDQRLSIIKENLGKVDGRLSHTKLAQGRFDLQKEADLALRNSSINEKSLMDAQMQLSLAEMMITVISTSELKLLPSNLGFQDVGITAEIKAYNDLLLEQEDLLKSSTGDNPVVMNMTAKLHQLRENLIQSLGNYKVSIEQKYTSLLGEQNKFNAGLSRMPLQESAFNVILRDQSTIEKIYIYLLEKREENAIKAAATPAVIKMVDEAYGYSRPISPKLSYVMLIALAMGIALPIGMIYLYQLLNNKVMDQEDLETLTQVPILGEIPLSVHTELEENDRSSLAEAIRILRTNIAFMVGKQKSGTVVYLTSTTSGEGKSFLATNLAKLLAASGKKTLLVGADIRSPKVLNYLGLSHLKYTHKGISEYLMEEDLTLENIVIKKPKPYHFDIIFSGFIAPNPAELLMKERFGEMIEAVREDYDFIVVDTAPVGMVTDTLLISEYADLTIYVLRSNYLDRRMLHVPNGMYAEHKLKNMAYLLNGVRFDRKYGYGYGGGYGYGYGDGRKDSEKGLGRLGRLGRLLRRTSSQ